MAIVPRDASGRKKCCDSATSLEWQFTFHFHGIQLHRRLLPAPDAVCKETQAVFDEVDSADEEALRLELLQVSTKLERRGGEQHAQLTAVQNVPGTDRQSVFGSLLAANAGRLSFVLAVVLPHAVAFSISLFLRRRVGGPQKTVEVLQEEEQLEPPRSTSVLFGNIKR